MCKFLKNKKIYIISNDLINNFVPSGINYVSEASVPKKKKKN